MGLRLRPEGEDWPPQGNAQGWVFAQHQPWEAKRCPEGRALGTAPEPGFSHTGNCRTFQAQRGGGHPLPPVPVENTSMEILLFTFNSLQAQQGLLGRVLGIRNQCLYLAFCHGAWII